MCHLKCTGVMLLTQVSKNPTLKSTTTHREKKKPFKNSLNWARLTLFASYEFL